MDNVTQRELVQWMKETAHDDAKAFSRGYQGHVYLYQKNGQRFIVKAPIGWGPGRLIRQMMLRNEYRVYSRLTGVLGVPQCYGFLDGRYLVLERIDGIPIRQARITDRHVFFQTLLNVIHALHKAGVAHGDLKKKDNLLVVDGKTPCVIDFGVAIVRKTGFAPLNRFLYDLARKFDFNAWVKLKYDRKYESILEEDRIYYNRTTIEKVSHRIKRRYVRLKKRVLRKRVQGKHTPGGPPSTG
jgi:tRNA A-37 threonylcarbamoyl transferase component Bud32